MTKHYEVRWPTVQEFKKYLTDMKRNTPVATLCKSGRCPIAQWIADTIPLPKNAEITVWRNGIDVERNHKFGAPIIAKADEAPFWAKRFISEIDYAPEEEWADLTATRCLKVLNKVIKELG